jgi:hypothetical protein
MKFAFFWNSLVLFCGLGSPYPFRGGKRNRRSHKNGCSTDESPCWVRDSNSNSAPNPLPLGKEVQVQYEDPSCSCFLNDARIAALSAGNGRSCYTVAILL